MVSTATSPAEEWKTCAPAGGQPIATSPTAHATADHLISNAPALFCVPRVDVTRRCDNHALPTMFRQVSSPSHRCDDTVDFPAALRVIVGGKNFSSGTARTAMKMTAFVAAISLAVCACGIGHAPSHSSHPI